MESNLPGFPFDFRPEELAELFLNPFRQNLRHVAVRVQNGNDLQRLQIESVFVLRQCRTTPQA